MFTKADLMAANAKFKMLQFYPTDGEAQGAVMELLAQMVPSKAALDWLVSTLVNRIGRWPGPAEVRGLLCWKFPPADGINVQCSLPGFTPEDGERLSLQHHEEAKQLAAADDPRALAEYLDSTKLLMERKPS